MRYLLDDDSLDHLRYSTVLCRPRTDGVHICRRKALRIRSLRILPSVYGAIYGVSNSVYGAVFDLRIWPSVYGVKTPYMAPYTEAKIRSSVYGAIYGDGVAPYMAPYTELKKISVYGAIYGAIYGVNVAPYTELKKISVYGVNVAPYSYGTVY